MPSDYLTGAYGPLGTVGPGRSFIGNPSNISLIPFNQQSFTPQEQLNIRLGDILNQGNDQFAKAKLDWLGQHYVQNNQGFVPTGAQWGVGGVGGVGFNAAPSFQSASRMPPVFGGYGYGGTPNLFAAPRNQSDAALQQMVQDYVNAKHYGGNLSMAGEQRKRNEFFQNTQFANQQRQQALHEAQAMKALTDTLPEQRFAAEQAAQKFKEANTFTKSEQQQAEFNARMQQRADEQNARAAQQYSAEQAAYKEAQRLAEPANAGMAQALKDYHASISKAKNPTGWDSTKAFLENLVDPSVWWGGGGHVSEQVVPQTAQQVEQAAIANIKANDKNFGRDYTYLPDQNSFQPIMNQPIAPVPITVPSIGARSSPFGKIQYPAPSIATQTLSAVASAPQSVRLINGSTASYDSIPSGTQYLAPNGRWNIKR